MSVDPLANKYPSLSPYNYCANSPLIFVDPDGTEPNNSKYFHHTTMVQKQFEDLWDTSGNFALNYAPKAFEGISTASGFGGIAFPPLRAVSPIFGLGAIGMKFNNPYYPDYSVTSIDFIGDVVGISFGLLGKYFGPIIGPYMNLLIDANADENGKNQSTISSGDGTNDSNSNSTPVSPFSPGYQTYKILNNSYEKLKKYIKNIEQDQTNTSNQQDIIPEEK
jgi:hypothetical protein